MAPHIALTVRPLLYTIIQLGSEESALQYLSNHALSTPRFKCSMKFTTALSFTTFPATDSPSGHSFWPLFDLAFQELVCLATFTFRFSHSDPHALSRVAARKRHFPPSLKTLRMIPISEESFFTVSLSFNYQFQHLTSLLELASQSYGMKLMFCILFPQLHGMTLAGPDT